MKEKIKQFFKEIFEGIKCGTIVIILITTMFNYFTIKDIKTNLRHYNGALYILLDYLRDIKKDNMDSLKRDVDITKTMQTIVANINALSQATKDNSSGIDTLSQAIIQTNETAIKVTKGLIDYIQKYPQLLEYQKRIKELKLLQVNVHIINESVGVQGSGATIKYKGKYYILSVAHLFEKPNDVLELWENGERICDLKIVKYDKKLDLALFTPKNEEITPTYYSELADSEPLPSEQIYVVGNPMGIEDFFSEGRIIRYDYHYAWYYDHSYFGSSGGGIYNKDGKIVGITSVLVAENAVGVAITKIPSFVINGAVRLSLIRKFMKDIK